MKHSGFKLKTIALIAAVGLSSANAEAAKFNLSSNSPVAKIQQKVQPVRPFRGQKPWGNSTAELNAKLSSKLNKNGRRSVAALNPYKEFNQLAYYDFLEGPDGTTWFYTSEYDIEYEQVSEFYTKEKIVGYTFTIYDSSFKEIGKIKDKITYNEGETDVAHAVLDPAASTKFFNTDDNTEVMVYLAMQTSDLLGYKVNYYNKVYSIGGEKDAEGNDVSIATVPGRCVDAFNTDTENENYFYTFVEDIDPDPSDFGSDQYLDFINAYKTQVSIYSKTNGEGAAPSVIFQKDIYMSRYPGDTTDGIYMITKNFNGTPYFIFSQYEKPYFVDPTGFATDESATEDNSLVIEVYTYDGGIKEVSTTKIPVEINKVEGEINYTFYSIGSVAWKDDVDMSVNGTPQAPAFIVARDYTKASNLEEVASSYAIYSNSGSLIRNLAEYTDGIAVLSSIEGEQPQVLFVNIDERAQYVFDFIDLYSGNKVLSLSQFFDGDPLTASCERVATSNGSYQYAFEMQYDETDANGNDVKRIAWFNKDGSLDRIDKINMGKDVMAASVNMYANSLSPYLYDTDDAMEYAVLVKRASGNTTKTEFLVVDDNGDWYITFSEADNKGYPMMFTIVYGSDQNRLQMVYRTDDYTYNVDIYDLPFNTESSSVKDVLAGSASSAISFNGTSVLAAGAYIEVYTTTGVKVAAGHNAVSLESLTHDIYIATARNSQGNSSTLKIAL